MSWLPFLILASLVVCGVAYEHGRRIVDARAQREHERSSHRQLMRELRGHEPTD